MSQFIEMFGTPENNHNDYPVIKIGEMVESINYGTSKPATDNGKYVYLRMNNITYDGKLDLSEVKRINLSPEEDDSAFVHKGDLMFNRTNTKEFVGKTTVFNLDEQMVVAGYIIRVRFKEKYSPEYVSGYLNSTYGKALLRKMAKGAVHQANINAQEFQGIQVLDVPKQEQDKYVTIAKQADKSGFDGHKSQFIEMFGDPIKNTMKLLSRKGEELFVFSSGKANTKSNLSNDFPYNCYGGNGITGHSNQWLIDYPTIVIGRVGEYCGCVHKTQGKVWITDNAIYIKEHKKNVFDDAFLFYLMTYLDFHRLADETGQPKITQRPLLDMEYIIPSKDLQQKFISIAEQADKSGSVLQYRIAC